MSIIEEALRRLEDPLLPPAKKPPAHAPDKPAAHSWHAAPPWAAASPTRPQMAPLAAVAVAVLALTVVLVIGGAFWMGRTLTTTPRADHPPAQASGAPAPAHPERPRRAPGRADASDLVLSGIVEGLGDPYAVINGMIVAVGERVGNATLEQIGTGSVRLRRNDGREIVLRVPR